MSQDNKFCSACGVVIDARAEICPKCGVRQMLAPFNIGGSAPNGKSKIVAGILGVFFGGIGVQHFYLGSIGLGILSVLFCWTFIPSLIGVIHGIILLCMSDAEFARKYGGT